MGNPSVIEGIDDWIEFQSILGEHKTEVKAAFKEFLISVGVVFKA